MIGLTTGGGNTSVGAETMFNVASGSNNTAIGNQSLISTSGNNNVGVGTRSGDNLTTGSNNTFLGTQARTTSAGATISNSTAIGYGAEVVTNNTIQLGNAGVSNVKTSGTLTAGSITYPNVSGTNGQVLTTDGNGTASWSKLKQIEYAQVLLSSLTDNTPVTVGGISIRVNNTGGNGPELEISRVSNSDPSTLSVYATVYKSNAGAFNAAADGTGGLYTPKFGTTIASANVGTWERLLDNANGRSQIIGQAYFKLDADISVYDSAKSYKLTLLIDGWGKGLLRLTYFP
jgi:hypothetical protein